MQLFLQQKPIPSQLHEIVVQVIHILPNLVHNLHVQQVIIFRVTIEEVHQLYEQSQNSELHSLKINLIRKYVFMEI